MTDSELMGLALEEARKAAALGEVPVGAVVARNGEVVAAAHNTRETEKNALHHAELLAIDAACKKLGGWRLWECELFVTLEPCPMCAGAIINSRIRRVVYGAADTNGGLLRQCDRPVCNALQPPPGGGAGAARRGSTGAAAGVFQGSAGTACGPAEVETACMTGMEYEETVKKWKLREKVGGFHFLFSANCAILFNGVLSKPILCSCLPRRAPDFDRIRNGR